jgi:hypothetical protein
MNREDKIIGLKRKGAMWKSWALVWGLALAFLLYGLLMFVIIGDKGPPDWDFNAVEDIPGKSVYSTSPEPGDAPTVPDPQHVADKPALAPAPARGGQK